MASKGKRTLCSLCAGAMWLTPTAKCDPVCRKCRAAAREVTHGTSYMYRNQKCRCEPCKQWYKRNSFRNVQCTVDGCKALQLGRGLCPTHYSAWHRSQRKYTVTCHCGVTAQVQKKTIKHCSYKCGMDAVNAAKAGMSVSDWLARPDKLKDQRCRPKVAKLRQCEWCLQLHDTKSKYCSRACEERFKENKQIRKLKMEQLRLFRRSFESGDFETFISELKRKSVISHDGCWLWPKLKRGYPVCDWSGKRLQVHRLALEAKHGKPLGTQHAHHMCATTACVNPDHLQPVTHRDNTAEMMQRHSYLSRIAELEEAVIELDPNHPVLNRIEVA